MNGLLTEERALPRFDLFDPAHIAPAIDALLDAAEQAVAHARDVSPPSWEHFVLPLEDASERFARAWSQIAHLEAVANTPALREAYNTQLPRVTRFWSQVGQDRHLHAQYKRLAESDEAAGYDAARRRSLANTLRDFRLGGAELDDASKARYTQIREAMAETSARFSQNVLDATDAFSLQVEDESRLSGLPEDVVAACRAAAVKAGKPGWTLGLQMPVYLPVLTLADDRDLRETLYRANAVRASELGDNAELDNSSLIDRILALRAELAGLLGFASYGEYSLATKMADTPAAVLSFLRDLAARAGQHAREDRVALEAFARAQLGLETVEAWDIAYASEKLKQSRYAFSAQEVKQYFTEAAVLSGLFDVVHDLYGLRVELDDAPVWHPDTRFYRLVDAQGNLVGQFYLDLYAREGKRGGAWMDDCRNRRDTKDGVQTPVVYLVCNFGKASDGRQATFSHSDVITLFHEMGHGLHQLLTRIGELSVAGINGVEWDAVELPSQFMENFCWEWSRVQAMTAHVDSGQPLPRELFDRMIAARNFQSGMAMLRQVEMAMFDMILHSQFDAATDSVQQVLDRVRDEVAVNIPPSWNRFPHQFSHIFAGGYAAGYYSYKWAEVLSADAYAAFEEAPDRLAEIGARFQDEVLARGGSRPAIENFKAFRGREPTLDALLRHSGMTAVTA